jgi:CRISPR system Cascade subunit CasC
MFVEFHVIQNFAPSNLNRDDTGNPKDAEFGGVRRARVSSQSFKRAIREASVFAKTTQVEPAKRTRRVVKMLRPPLHEAGKPEEEVNQVLAFFVPNYLAKLESKLKDPDDDARTKVMVFISQDEVQAIAEALLEHWDEMIDGNKRTRRSVARELTKKFKDITSAPDIALFGRMLAQKPVLNIDAACQVAHALSTHRVTMEMDFWTAVDDLKKLDADDEIDAGAGGMGFTGFDSACFYRYVRLDWEQLLKNLGGDVDLARRSVEAFMRALVEAVPSGKQNSFAAHNPPSLMFATVRKGSFGWSLTNAFERPIYPRQNEGLVAPSVAALDTYWQRLVQVYGETSIQAQAALALDPDLPLESLAAAEVPTLDAWIETTLTALPHEEA